MSKTKIEWADEVWNPVTGCTPISEGCQNCYAKRMAQRLKGRFGYPEDEPFSVTLHADKLHQPLKWKKPRRVFVVSMGDLFHVCVRMTDLTYILDIISKCKWHTFMILTKRIDRASKIMDNPIWWEENKHVWLGVSCENQQRADERIPILLQIPAAKRFVSIEPMLGPMDLCQDLAYPPFLGVGRIDWVIAGCESGPNRRQAKRKWFRELKDQCVAAGIPFFLKQMEEPHMFGHQQKRKVVKMPYLDGRQWNEMPKLSSNP